MLPKLSQSIAPAKKTYTVKFSKAKKEAQTIAVKFKASGGGKVTYRAAKTAGGKVRIARNGKVTVAKEAQAENAPGPISSTLPGTSTAASRGQAVKAVSSMRTTPAGMVTASSLAFIEKALRPMTVTLSPSPSAGMATLVSSPV